MIRTFFGNPKETALRLLVPSVFFLPVRAGQRLSARAGRLLLATFLLATLLLAASAPAAAQTTEPELSAERESTATRAEERPPELNRQFQRALTAWRTGASLLEAKARLDEVLSALPTDVAARKLRAEVLLEMGRPKEALRDARRATELAPQDGKAYLLQAEAARESSRFEEARCALERAAKHLPEEAALHTRFSWNAMLLDRLAQAEAFGRVAVALDSTSAPAYHQLTRVFLQRERPDEAAAVLERGLRAGVLQPGAILEDEQFGELVDHPRLEALLRP